MVNRSATKRVYTYLAFAMLVIALITSLPTYAAQYNVAVPRLLSIRDMPQVFQIINALNKAKDGDTVYMKVDSDGGDMWIMDLIIKAMDKSKANVVADCSTMCASAAAIIWMAADDRISTLPGSVILFHLPRTAAFTGEVVIITLANAEKYGAVQDYMDFMAMFERRGIVAALAKLNSLKEFLDGKDVAVIGADTLATALKTNDYSKVGVAIGG